MARHKHHNTDDRRGCLNCTAHKRCLRAGRSGHRIGRWSDSSIHRPDRAMALIWGPFGSVFLKEVSFRQSSTAGSCSLCEFNIIPRLPAGAGSWDRGRLRPQANCRGGGHPQGVPLRLDYEGAHTGGGHPRGVPLLRFGYCEGAHTGGRAHTRGGRAHTRGGRAHTRGGGRTHGGEGTHEGAPTVGL